MKPKLHLNFCNVILLRPRNQSWGNFEADSKRKQINSG